MAKFRACFYAARCMICFKRFAVPVLSEFSFGEFLYTSDNGKSFANYNVFEEIEISEIVDTKLTQNTVGKSINEIQKNDLKYKVIGLIADKSDNKKGYITGKNICPRCGKKHIWVNEDKKLRTESIPALEFSHFKSLTIEEKDELIQNCILGELN